MNKQTKLILSLIGVSALIVPAVLLIVFTNKNQQTPEVQSDSRQIDSESIKQTTKKAAPSPVEFPSPSPATTSAKPSPFSEGTSSSH